jgi:hypothetical protein
MVTEEQVEERRSRLKSEYERAMIDKHAPNPDRWINRSAEMRCHSCMHYVSKIGDKGRCRRHAPTLGGWPVVFETDWCGDHKLS